MASKLSEKTVNALLKNVTSRVTDNGNFSARQDINHMDHIFHKVLDTHYPISIRNQRIIARYGNDEHKIKLRNAIAHQNAESEFKPTKP